MRIATLYILAAVGAVHVSSATQPKSEHRWIYNEQENGRMFLPRDVQNPWGDMFYCLAGTYPSSTRDHEQGNEDLNQLMLTSPSTQLPGGRRAHKRVKYAKYPSTHALFHGNCGDGFCECEEGTADCSGQYGDLTYVPHLPDNVTHLIFKNNNLTSIPSDDFFSNVTNITILDISDNDIGDISPGVFGVFNNLTTLCLKNTRLTYDTLTPVWKTTSLKVLDISNGPPGPPPDGTFEKYPMPNLESLAIMQNGISNLNMSVFSPLDNLKYLSLHANALSVQTFYPHHLPHLRALDLSQNSFYNFFQTCQNVENHLTPGQLPGNHTSRTPPGGKRRVGNPSSGAYNRGKKDLARASKDIPERGKMAKSFFPNLTALSFAFNDFSVRWRSHSICLPKLDFFCLDRTYMLDIFPDMFKVFPSLRYVTLIASSLQLQIHPHAFRHPRLEEVDVSYSNIDFSQDVVSADMFSGCPALQTVVLSHNDFDKVTEDKFQRLFSQAPNLQTIILADINIGRLSPDMFTGMPQVHEVQLQANRIGEVPDGVFDGLPKLQTLSLAFNQIHTIRETTFGEKIRAQFQIVSLSNNAFQCDCDLRWFQHWLVSEPSLFHFINDVPPFYPESENRYMCTNLANSTVQSFFVADQACLWNPAVSKFIIASIVLLVLPLAMATALYRYRWHIRLVLFEAFRGQGDRWRRLQEHQFLFDVFVSYDKQDLRWVRAHLMPELEGRLRLRLCIHERDFTIGTPIVENIEESVQTSKKVLMVFSRNFARSHWCQYELQRCLSHVMENDDMLLVVLLEDIPSRELTPAMMAVMKTTTYIEWADEADARHSFWQRLRLALHEILPAV